MRFKLIFAWLGCAALVLNSPVPAPAMEFKQIIAILIGLKSDPGNILLDQAETDANGKFEFTGLKAGTYRLVILPQSDSETAKQTTVVPGAPLQLQRTFTVTVTHANDAPTIGDTGDASGRKITTLLIGPDTGRSSPMITVEMDGGAIRGSFKIAENESPRPQDRLSGTGINGTGAEKQTIVSNGAALQLEGNKAKPDPNSTPATRVTAIPVDPMDTSGNRSTSVTLTAQGGDDTTYYVGTANGGIWKNADGAPLTINSSHPVDLGIALQPVDGGGFSITSVANGSLAQQLGLQPNDQILSANGRPLQTASAPLTPGQTVKSTGVLRFEVVGASLKLALQGQSPGPAVLVVDRGGMTLNFSVLLHTTISVDSGTVLTLGEKWRYKHQNGEWWYYGPDEKWLIHRNGEWISYAPTGTVTAQPGGANIFDRWGNLRTGVNPGTKADTATGNKVHVAAGDVNGDGVLDDRTANPNVGLPGIGSPGGVLPGRKQTGVTNPGSGLRRPFGNKK